MTRDYTTNYNVFTLTPTPRYTYGHESVTVNAGHKRPFDYRPP